MRTPFTYRTFLFLLVLILAGACKKVVVTVDGIPRNTPSGQPIFITGNFNNWDPGDVRYQLLPGPDSTYTISLPPGFGTIEYKFTRGDWTTVEKDICGYEIENRRLVIAETDTAVNSIASWNDMAPLDCPRLTLLVSKVPEGTAPGDRIAVAGNFNSWSIDSSAFLRRDSAGGYSVTIDRPVDNGEIEFKFTRGELASAEADEFGNMIPNRVMRFGVKDTVEVQIEGWIDRPPKGGNRVVILLDRLPSGSPVPLRIFMASSLNGWMPGDMNYLFQVAENGKLYFPLPRKSRPTEFKLTRGDWSTVEVDGYGYDIANRIIQPDSPDTVRLIVEGWKDRSLINDRTVTLVIDRLPPETPAREKLYIAGNFNGWDPGRTKNSFHDGPGGRPVIDLPRDKGLLEFRITRGSWDNAEVSADGLDIPNRVHAYSDIDTLYLAVENWKDMPPRETEFVTLVIEALPENTPRGDRIFLAPDFNGWDPGDPALTFRYLPDGRPFITVQRRIRGFAFKITRGNWETVETDTNGDPIADRTVNFGFADTVNIRVVKWRDLGGRY